MAKPIVVLRFLQGVSTEGGEGFGACAGGVVGGAGRGLGKWTRFAPFARLSYLAWLQRCWCRGGIFLCEVVSWWPSPVRIRVVLATFCTNLRRVDNFPSECALPIFRARPKEARDAIWGICRHQKSDDKITLF